MPTRSSRSPFRTSGRAGRADRAGRPSLPLPLALTAVVVGLLVVAGAALWPSLFARTSDPLSVGDSTRGLRDAGLVVEVDGMARIDAEAARTLLAGIPRHADGSAGARYDRDLFGQRWADTDRNGCDQRNDVLRRDLTGIRTQDGTRGCVVVSGTLDDLYSGSTIAFVRGENTSARVQIDHIVPLSWAWRHGASTWPADTRERFANDVDNLLAVDGPTNTAKSDSGPAEWMPPQHGFACEYVARFTAVLADYDLGIDDADRRAIDDALDSCPR